MGHKKDKELQEVRTENIKNYYLLEWYRATLIWPGNLIQALRKRIKWIFVHLPGNNLICTYNLKYKIPLLNIAFYLLFLAIQGGDLGPD